MILQACWTYRDLVFKKPSGTSRGVLKNKRSYFIKITDEKGNIGYGECGVLKGLSIDYLPGYEQCLNILCANINTAHPDQFYHYPSIRFGLETALLSLKSNHPMELFDSDFINSETPMKINGLIWMGSFEFMNQQIKEKIEQGFSCLKLKIGAIDFNQELSLIKQIRKQYSAKDIEIRVDANGGFSFKDALAKLDALAKCQLHSIEQPIKQNQWEQMSKLCQNTPLPIALDEELIGMHELKQQHLLLDTIKPQFLIFKPSLLGGFRATNQWIDSCKIRGIAWWITSALESNIGLNAISQFTFNLKNPLPQGLGTGQLYTNNITSPLHVENGEISYRKNGNWDISNLFAT